ncbi:heme-binding protein [Deinococcus sp. SDU3-2]|uniref:Heme-binding protein n=1 Tax=Deinococcus terrestris TaxID=2651870 RepID=A0A7X1TSN1_9DEIO|nr:heme-binding protein [Deinococcus terrestris]MPY68023.1 heme-binding protein [Deinococcus terrestris]
MKRILLGLLALSLPTALAQTTPAQTPPAPSPVRLAATATVPQASLSLAAALRIAQLAVTNCAAQGYNVTATVVDRAGITLAVARAENAGPHTVDASFRKAYTSASARNTTAAIAENIRNNPASAELARIDRFLVLAGGAPIRVEGAVVGAIGVGGAPSGQIDEKCGTDAATAVLGR